MDTNSAGGDTNSAAHIGLGMDEHFLTHTESNSYTIALGSLQSHHTPIPRNSQRHDKGCMWGPWLPFQRLAYRLYSVAPMIGTAMMWMNVGFLE